ncbi:MAG TPA: tRNA (adenosine(37)-N6)-dimethylallyltransferase MiaA [Clostridiaceae bacterium]
MKNKKLIIISGPTAVGKTNISIKLAQRLKGEIISADSMQIYKHMNIGSAKISSSEMEGIPHHLIDIIEPDVSFSAAEFKTLAKIKMEEMWEIGKLPILVGGTGLYINSLICDYDFASINKDQDYRNSLEELLKTEGAEYLHSKLKEVDSYSFEKLYPSDVKRVIRALEVYKLTGKTINEFKEENKKKPLDFEFKYFVLTMNRNDLYNKINDRVEDMLKKGLLDEVSTLKAQGYNISTQSMKGIGYKELLDYLDGHISYYLAVEKIKQGSRNYAKRQLTWFRKEQDAIWIDKEQFNTEEEIVDFIINTYQNNNSVEGDCYE